MKQLKIVLSIIFVILFILPFGCVNPDKIEIDSPKNLLCNSITNNSVVLSWNEVYGAVQYGVYYSLQNNFSGASKILTLVDTNLQVIDLESSTKYYFWVTTITSTGTSLPSESLEVSTKLGTPSFLKAEYNIADQTVSLSWGAVKNATKYYINYSETSNVNNLSDLTQENCSQTTSTSSIIDVSLCGNVIYFIVFASNDKEINFNSIVTYVRKNIDESKIKKIWDKVSCNGEKSYSDLEGNKVGYVRINTSSEDASTSVVPYIQYTNQLSNTLQNYSTISVKTKTSRSAILPGQNYTQAITKIEPDQKILNFNNSVHQINSTNISKMKNESRTISKSYTIGSQRSFWVENVYGNFVSKKATLRASGSNCYIWIVDENYQDSSISGNDNRVTLNTAKKLATVFDKIYTYETDIFGNTYGKVFPSGIPGLITPAEKISILVYDIDGDYSSSQTGGVLGFFWAKDFFSDDDDEIGSMRSNEDEMFYLDAYFLDYAPGMIHSTLAHEFQHMISFVNKNLKHGKDTSTWYNEMLSMLCEDLLQDVIGITDEEGPKGRLSTFNNSYSISPLGEWLLGNDVYYSYASTYAYGAFLVRNFGGPELLEKISHNDTVDFQSINDAIIELQGSSPFTNSLKDIIPVFARAICYSDLPLDFCKDDILHLNKTVSYLKNDVEYKFVGIRLADYYFTIDNKIIFGPYSYNEQKQSSVNSMCFLYSDMGIKTEENFKINIEGYSSKIDSYIFIE